MKRTIFTILASFLVSYSFAQNYEQQIAKAEEFVSKKDFCNAYEIFKPLLIDSDQGSIYEYYYASLSAVNCEKNEDALNWLNVAAEKGLGLKDGEIDFIKKDDSFKELKSTEKWASIINTMQNKFADKKLIEEAKSKEWVSTITKNAIQQKKSKFNTVGSPFSVRIKSSNFC